MAFALFTTLITTGALLLMLALPTFPDGLTIPIVMFLGMLGAGGLGGFFRAPPARAELALLAPWLLGLGLGLMVGLVRGNPLGQALEDALPYFLFALGLCAGRGASRPVWLLLAVLFVCLCDAFQSLWLMPSYDISRYRSTFNFFKVITGHLLVGIYCVAFLYRMTTTRRQRALLVGAQVLLVLAVIATVSRGMVLGLMLGVLSAIYVRRPARGVMVAGAMALLGVVFATTAMDLGAQYLRFGNVATVDGRVREIGMCLEYFVAMPMFGAGLGAQFVVDGFVVSYVHNMLAYHLWKFGVVGSALFVLPIAAMARQALRVPSPYRSTVIGGAVSVLVYLVTAASYKSYFLVPMVGVVVGASLRITLPGSGTGAGKGTGAQAARGAAALLPAAKAPSVGRA